MSDRVVPPRQPEWELLIAIDKCAFFTQQLRCISALHTLGQAANARVRVRLLVTDMDYSEKLGYRDPSLIDRGIKRSDVGYKFANYIIENRKDVLFVGTPVFAKFIDTFQQEILNKELLGSQEQLGLFDLIADLVQSRPSADSFPLENMTEDHPLYRFRKLSSSPLFDMAEDAKKGVYRTMKMLEGPEILQMQGIASVDDISFAQAAEFLANCPPATALQALHDSPSIYNLVIRTSRAFCDAKNDAGERSVFEGWDYLQRHLKSLEGAERRAFGKEVSIAYITNDNDSLMLLAQARLRLARAEHAKEGDVKEVIPLHVMHANTFVDLLKGVADDVGRHKLRSAADTALSELKEAKAALNTAMPHDKQHIGRIDDSQPRGTDTRGAFVSMVGDSLKKPRPPSI